MIHPLGLERERMIHLVHAHMDFRGFVSYIHNKYMDTNWLSFV